jgi:insulysin
MLSDPAFNVLRTREQLGYVVSCGRWVLSGATHVGMRIVVQSERGPTYLEERVERFLESMETVILNMDDKEFTDQKAGLEKKWREKHKNLGEELSSYWPHLESGFLDFCQGGFPPCSLSAGV